MNNAILYLRYSTLEQSEGQSERSQTEIADWWCKEFADEFQNSFRHGSAASSLALTLNRRLRRGRVSRSTPQTEVRGRAGKTVRDRVSPVHQRERAGNIQPVGLREVCGELQVEVWRVCRPRNQRLTVRQGDSQFGRRRHKHEEVGIPTALSRSHTQCLHATQVGDHEVALVISQGNPVKVLPAVARAAFEGSQNGGGLVRRGRTGDLCEAGLKGAGIP